MELQPWSSPLITNATILIHRAWHVVSLLLSLGRPARVVELAEMCTLFGASPELVQFLCGIPDSPLSLTTDGFVTLSLVAFAAFGRFIVSNTSRIVVGLGSGNSGSIERLEGNKVIRTYSRKRRRLGNEVVPAVKKAAVLRELEENRPVVCTRLGASANAFTVHEDPSPFISRALRPFFVAESAFKWVNFTETVTEKPLALWCKDRSYFEDRESKPEYSTSIVSDMLNNQHVRSNDDRFISNMHQATSLDPSVLLALPCYVDEKDFIMVDRTGNVAHNAQPRLGKSQSSQEQQVESLTPTHASDTEDLDNIKINEDPAIGHNTSKIGVKPSSSLRKAVCRDVSVGTDSEKETLNLSKNPFTSAKDIPVHDQDAFLPCKVHTAPSVPRNSPKRNDKCQHHMLNTKLQVLSKPSEQNKANVCKSNNLEGKNTITLKQKVKQIHKSNPDKDEISHGNPSKDRVGSKALPKFECFIAEDEEGSGGYGTVYRARRKSDGALFAVKYPHPNAHKHHIDNEQKMLERFGGRNFVIKYEGSFKSGNLDCFVLEHVEHDRPDVLRREINIYQLQWYGYCMFRALASLHKHGVVHRDVKPGNFLFSRKNSKGYLIDFNLAKDLHQKPANTDKGNSSAPIEHVPAPHLKTVSPGKHKKLFIAKSSKPLPGGSTSKGFKSSPEAKMLKNKAFNAGHRNSMPSQGADGSGLTSAKDVTSNKTPSAERLREPLPSQGRRELISLAQEAMQSPNHETTCGPASKRKRIAAPPSGIASRKLVYHTPMPIHSSGIAIPGSGLSKRRGDGKIQKEGPCAGTKGFRAPEVLIQSVHQGPKLDVWSAGVTLLYLIIGKVPFTGDPEQNMKELVKLRGNEELWEVAKLHNRESTLPLDLLDVRFLQAMDLREWCKANNKRPDFLETIPESLYDLVDKCLSVNPRLRISAEDALRHEFFAPCHEALGKMKMRRLRNLELEVHNRHLVHETSTTGPGRALF